MSDSTHDADRAESGREGQGRQSEADGPPRPTRPATALLLGAAIALPLLAALAPRPGAWGEDFGTVGW
ncbi:hypothetical protein, partial [Streptomyces sp. NPDC059900]